MSDNVFETAFYHLHEAMRSVDDSDLSDSERKYRLKLANLCDDFSQQYERIGSDELDLDEIAAND